MADRILVLDNHDSFVHTLVGYLRELGAEVSLLEADAVTDAAAAIVGVAGVVISPGPGRPEAAGASMDVIRAAATARTPLLGVCLGHQALAAAFGARVGEAAELVHGRTSTVFPTEDLLFRGLPSPFQATRYHSLAVDRTTLPAELDVTAETASGEIMALTHRSLPLRGVQFHPESVLTEGGYGLLGNWLESAGLSGASTRGARLDPHRGDAPGGGRR